MLVVEMRKNVLLCFGQQFLGHTSSEDTNSKFSQVKTRNEAERGEDNTGSSSQPRKMRLTPLSDAIYAIMAQVAFLSALVGVEVAEAAAQAALASLSKLDPRKKEGVGPFANGAIMQEPGVVSNGDATSNTWERAYEDAKTLLEKEELDAERAMYKITEVQKMLQMKEIRDKIDQFEAFELHMEKEWQHIQQMKNLLFVDQLTLFFIKLQHQKPVESLGEGNLKED